MQYGVAEIELELSELTHELLGKLALGIDPDEQPRWG